MLVDVTNRHVIYIYAKVEVDYFNSCEIISQLEKHICF